MEANPKSRFRVEMCDGADENKALTMRAYHDNFHQRSHCLQSPVRVAVQSMIEQNKSINIPEDSG